MVFESAANTILLKPYAIPIDHNLILHFHSNHPYHLCANLPFGQFLQIKHKASLQWDYSQESMKLRDPILHRGYPIYMIRKARIKAQTIECNSLFQNKNRTQLYNLCFFFFTPD